MWALAVAHAAPVVDVAHHPCSMLSHGRVANVPPCAFVLVAVCPPRLLWYSPSRSGGVLTVAVFAHAAVAVLQVGRAGFFPRNRCNNGYDCDFCHYEHEKRKRKNKKSKKKNKEGVRGGGGGWLRQPLLAGRCSCWGHGLELPRAHCIGGCVRSHIGSSPEPLCSSTLSDQGGRTGSHLLSSGRLGCQSPVTPNKYLGAHCLVIATLMTVDVPPARPLPLCRR